MQCIMIEDLIKLTQYGETKKKAHGSHIVRANENVKSTVGPAKDKMRKQMI